MIVHRFAGQDALIAGAAEQLAALIRGIASTHGVVRIALAGGSTPRPLYERLATIDLPWDRIEWWFGDERCVPPDHADSNYRMAREALLDSIDERTIVHRIRGELPPAEAADHYERELVDALGTSPRLHLVLLGLGGDGHTASLFPYSPALPDSDRWVVATERAGEPRITLTRRTIAAAHHVRFVVSGSSKAGVLAEVLEGPHDPGRLPAQLIDATETDVEWFVDEAAATRLRRTP